jgi:hypothetical protein
MQTLISTMFPNGLRWLGGQILVQAPPATGKTAFISLFQRTKMEYNTIRHTTRYHVLCL